MPISWAGPLEVAFAGAPPGFDELALPSAFCAWFELAEAVGVDALLEDDSLPRQPAIRRIGNKRRMKCDLFIDFLECQGRDGFGVPVL